MLPGDKALFVPVALQIENESFGVSVRLPPRGVDAMRKVQCAKRRDPFSAVDAMAHRKMRMPSCESRVDARVRGVAD